MATRKVFCFGNEFVQEDKAAIELADSLTKANVLGFEFVKCNSPEMIEGDSPIILDVVQNLSEPKLLGIEMLKDNNMMSLHDFDLGFNLMLMHELGEIKKADIIGIPADFHVKEMDRVIEMLKRL